MEEEYIPFFNDSDVGYWDYDYFYEEEKKEESDEKTETI
jgi:hypothetical protein